MKTCSHCGAENKSDARFCKSCGSALSAEDTAPMRPVDEEASLFQEQALQAEESERRVEPKKVAVVALAALLLVVAGVFGFGYLRRAGLRRSAEAAMEEENYDKAYQDFKKLYAMTASEEDEEAVEAAKELSKDQSSLDSAERALDAGRYEEALRRYVAVKDHDNALSETAEEGIDNTVKAAESKVRAYNEAEEFQQATGLLSSLLATAPENSRLLTLKEEVNTGKDRVAEAESAKKVRAANRETQANKNKEKAANKAKRASEGSRILYTTQHVTTSTANVRSGPGKGYPVIYELPYGTEVYVIDTQADSVRTWCNIGDGWISYRTLNGEL